jgi:hypothetical protein
VQFFDDCLSSGLRPRLVIAGCSAPCNIAVIPAKAGIQDLQGIARKARDIFKTWIPAFAGMTMFWEAKPPAITKHARRPLDLPLPLEMP